MNVRKDTINMAFFITGLTTATVKQAKHDCLLYTLHTRPKYKFVISIRFITYSKYLPCQTILGLALSVARNESVQLLGNSLISPKLRKYPILKTVLHPFLPTGATILD